MDGNKTTDLTPFRWRSTEERIEERRMVKLLEKKGKNALLVKENCDVASRNIYMVIIAINYEKYMGMDLYDKKIEFTVSSNVPQKVKDELLQMARKHFNSIS